MRAHDLDAAALAQLSAEFSRPSQGVFDRFVDGLNRLPRPLIVLGIIWLLARAVMDPIRATEEFTALSIIPTPIWVIIGSVVAFFFGGRAQIKDLDFAREMAETANNLPAVLEQLDALREMRAESPRSGDIGTDAELEVEVHDDVATTANPALSAWRLGDAS